MRDHARLNAEIGLLKQHFGEDRVYWDSQGQWVMIKELPLPERLSQRASDVIVLIPENYGNGSPLRDAFIDPDIRAYNTKKKQYEEIPHYFSKYPYAKLTLGNKEEWQQKGWQYICLHQKNGSGNHISIMNYLTDLYKFLAEPFRDWEKTFSSYRGRE